MVIRELVIHYKPKYLAFDKVELGDDEPFTTPTAAKRVAKGLLQLEPCEVFGALLFTAKRHLIGYREVSRGILNECYANPREIIQAALLANASAIIVCHNHPSGVPTPSPEDILSTRAIQEACKVMKLDLLDHVIVGFPEVFSFKEGGLL